MIRDSATRRAGAHPGWRPAASDWLFAAAIGGAALAVGTVHTATLCVVTAVLAVAALLSGWNAEPTQARPAATLLFGTGAALTAYTLLQCIPIPLSVLERIAPRNADVWSRALRPLHEPAPQLAPISIDPTATRIEVLKGVAYLLAFLTALRIARRREGTAFLGGTLVVTGLALAVTALLHPAFGAQKLYGVWTPSMDFGRHLAPFLNPNNLAGYINVAICLALAASLAPEPRVARPILAACALVLIATQVWVASRGGIVTMVLGIILVVVTMRAGRLRSQRTIASVTLGAAIAAVSGVFMIVLGQSEDASSEFFTTDLTKLEIFGQSMRMVPQYLFFGTGRGAFESAFPAFRQGVGYVDFAYPENVVAQWVVEWGVPFGLAGLAAVVVGLRPSSVLARSSTAAGAWAALVTVAVHSLCDLGSEIPGLMLACVVCAAIVVGGVSGRKSTSPLTRWSVAPRGVAVGATVAAAFAILGAAMGIGHELSGDRRTLYATLSDDRTPAQTARTVTRAAIARHPAEPYLPYAAATWAAATREGSPIPWIEATLERARVYAPAHLLLARSLTTRSPSQARLEYRLTMEQSLELMPTVTAEVPRVIGGFYDAMEVVPSGKGAPWVLEQLSAKLRERLPSTSERLDAELAIRSPSEPGPVLRVANAALEDLEAGEGAPWCEQEARSRCIECAAEGARHAEVLAPDKCQPRLLRAKAAIARGDASAALDSFVDAIDIIPAVDERVRCLQSLEGMAVDAHDDLRATAAITKIANLGCADAAECARNLGWIAAAEERRGNQGQALAQYRRAYEQAPDSDILLESVARLAATSGLHAEAAESYERLAQRHPQESRWTKAAADARAAAVKGALKL